MSDIVKKLHDDRLFKLAVSGLEDDEQRKRIVSFTETFVTELDAALQLALQRIKDDASLQSQLSEALTEASPLLSGSTDR